MKLYLVQHGNCNTEEVDPAKNLSVKGQADILKLGQYLAKISVSISGIWHSGKARAEQTAQIIAKSLKPTPSLVMKEGLLPNDQPEQVLPLIQEQSNDLMIVGHMPHLSRLASLLLSNTEDADLIAFQQGGIVCLQKTDQKLRIEWMITPELL